MSILSLGFKLPRSTNYKWPNVIRCGARFSTKYKHENIMLISYHIIGKNMSMLELSLSLPKP